MSVASATEPLFGYFPAIVCVVCDSPIDALVALCVPRGEAMELVTASWRGGETDCILTHLAGGRPIAVMQTPEGRWAACNAFLEPLCETPQDARRKLDKLLRRGRHGYVGQLRHMRPVLPCPDPFHPPFHPIDTPP